VNLSGNTVLVTGGASGIGLALARRFLDAGSTVIICGRRGDKLHEAQGAYPAMHVAVADIARDDQRLALVDWVTTAFPALNVLVNNAGVQRRVSLLEQEPWDETRQEIAINLEAPIHLSRLIVPHLIKQEDAAIINVTSGLSFAPLAAVPVYCATKAALHSFTLSLRHQLRDSPVQVIEVVPPAVNTDLGGPGLHTFGADVDAFADSVMGRIAGGELEVGYGTAEQSRRASRDDLDALFVAMNPHAS
jgi:uncharacterized oxidoreductase